MPALVLEGLYLISGGGLVTEGGPGTFVFQATALVVWSFC